MPSKSKAAKEAEAKAAAEAAAAEQPGTETSIVEKENLDSVDSKNEPTILQELLLSRPYQIVQPPGTNETILQELFSVIASFWDSPVWDSTVQEASRALRIVLSDLKSVSSGSTPEEIRIQLIGSALAGYCNGNMLSPQSAAEKAVETADHVLKILNPV